ncbi:MAG: formyltetrahydrofolate deformylase [Acidobacteriota bacterium]
MKKDTAILLVYCKDRPGLVNLITGFILGYGGNILYLDQHADHEEKNFFMRIEWDLQDFTVKQSDLEQRIKDEIISPLGMRYQLYFSSIKPRMAIFVSKQAHCFADILHRYSTGEWQVDIPLVISNHEDLRRDAERYEIPFFCVPKSSATKAEQEKRELKLLREHEVEFIVLARYMQILSGEFVDKFPNRIINIHHSFLPAFPGSNPYRAAADRGVKIIGATSHYVTSDLDAGPIIEQGITRVSHRDTVEDMIRKGRDVERVVLAKAVYQHINRKILVLNNRTVVFE